jgi:phosphoserine phosphatase
MGKEKNRWGKQPTEIQGARSGDQKVFSRPVAGFGRMVLVIVLLFCGTGVFGAGRTINPQQAREQLLTAGWSAGVVDQILSKVAQASGRMIAVFDHDNTLVCGDVTEGSSRNQPGLAELMILGNRLRNPAPLPHSLQTPQEIWQHYHHWTKTEPQNAYPWVTTVFGGYSEQEARQIAGEYYQKYFVSRIFPEMKAMVRVLQDLGVEVFIVSASCEWFVKPAAKYFDLPESHVFGIRLRRSNGIIQPQAIHPISFAAGKTWYIQNLMGAFPPGNLLVFGDSLRTDGHMLRFGARQGGFALLVNPADELWDTLRRDGIEGFPLPSLKSLQ